MARSGWKLDDSSWQGGGSIPGLQSVAAFSLTKAEPSSIPVLIAVPHAGRCYPDSLLGQMRNPGFAALRLEDRLVDGLAGEVAAQTGASLLVAHAPRAMIDLNRAENDIDWGMIASGSPAGLGAVPIGRRAKAGLGLIPRRLPGLGEIWKRKLATQELATRIEAVHRPYHACLQSALADLKARWGAALLIDLHSMPPLAPESRNGKAELVIGDRFGASCDGGLIGACFSILASESSPVAHNRPYAGGYVLERHGAPREGIHALQIEIDRSCYLDSRLAEPGPGFSRIVSLLTGLVRQLAERVADISRNEGERNWLNAAE